MSEKNDDSVFKNLTVAFVILIIHVVLIGAIAVMGIFFGWIANNAGWIILGVSCLIIVAGYLFYRRMKSDAGLVKEILRDPALQGKTVEISFLGGMANVKVGDAHPDQAIAIDSSPRIKQLDAPQSETGETLTALASLYEKKLISLEEFNKAKQKILK